ncbi:MAG: LacI family DNA-binding transcriptional regulator [Akkermansiaceae bacterium]|nr:LacI family DNA-binding transcriptional regulator [Armatimonadota bacterium]
MIKYPGMSAKKNVTLKSVAERAGTSIQTVSTVLNSSRSNTVVSAETRARILSVAEEMQYRRNAHARSLRRGYTNIIGFYTGYGTVSQTNPFIAEVFGGIQRGCNENKKDLLIHGTFRGNSADDIYDELTSGKIDGLVIFAPLNNSLVTRLQSAPLPVVAIAEPVPGIMSVIMDDVQGGREAARHLYERGHRHILYRHPGGAFISAKRRLAGLQAEADRCGMKVTPVVEPDHPPFAVSDAGRALLTATDEDKPTAVVCWCDASADVALEFLAENHIAVPEQIAVVGFDGFTRLYVGGVQLTTLVAPWAEAGNRAVSLLTGEESLSDDLGNEIKFAMHLRQGDTT